MKTVYAPIINEEAYLPIDEERKLLASALKTIEEKNMNYEESEKYLEKFPMPQMFASAYRDILGEEGYRKFEERNSEIIRTRAWNNE